MAYMRLTKKVTNEDGEEAVICAFYGTDRCPAIHNDSVRCEAAGCQIPKIMMQMLFEFENSLTENSEEELQ